MDRMGMGAGSPITYVLLYRRGYGVLVLAAVFFLAACAGGGNPGSKTGEGKRLDILTSFTLALSKRDFRSATDMLAPAERARFLDGGGEVPPDLRERLRAMRLSTLVNNPTIHVEGGKIRGILDMLPVIEQAPPVDSPSASIPAPPLDTPFTVLKPAEGGQEGLRTATETFFKSVRERDWNRALGMVNPRERAVFLKSDGQIKESARRRLVAIDTASWEALTVEDGKLTGVVLIIPDKPPVGGNPAAP